MSDVKKDKSYWRYTKVEELLALQTGFEDDEAALGNDEVMFIVTHQIDELWFKLVLRELTSIRDLFAQEHVREQSLASAARGLRRVSLLFAQIGQHFALMETMTTRDYLGFRDGLRPASGFQSAQLREIEILLGLDDEDRIPLGYESSYRDALKHKDGSASPASNRVARRRADLPTLRDAIQEWLHRAPIQGSVPGDPDDHENVTRFINDYVEAASKASRLAGADAMRKALTEADSARLEARYEKERESIRRFLLAHDEPEERRARKSRIRAATVFIESYRELPLLAWPREIVDRVIEMEQSMLIFRQRHARMVERVIGRRVGTGGSAGVEYLDNTALAYRVFKDIWAVRSILLREDALPSVREPERYALTVSHLPPP